MIQSKLNYIIALFFIMLIPLTASAADFHVTTAQELQTALSTANSNGVDDIVYLSAGTYAGHFSYQPNESQAITIKAEDGLNPGQVVLDGNSNGRTLLLSAGTNVADMTLERISIINGNSGTGNGGGLNVVTDGDINIVECTLSNNSNTSTSEGGGGAHLDGIDIVVQNSIFSSNTTPGRSGGGGAGGGGLSLGNSAANVTIENNTFNDNASTNGSGAGLYLRNVTAGITISNNNFSNNTSRYSGAAISFYTISGDITVTINANTIEYNEAQSGGAVGIYLGSGANRGTMNITNNSVKNNTGGYYSAFYIHYLKNINFTNNSVANNTTTSGHTGGVYLCAETALTFNNNIIADNRANNSHTGGAYLQAPTITVTNNIITGNTAGTYAGGLCLSSTTLHFTNNTVYGNTASSGDGGGIYTYAGGSGGIHFYNNIIWGNSASGQGDDLYLSGTGSADKNLKYNSIHDYGGTLFNFVSNNIDVDPLFIDSGNDDYHLGAASLCLDVGDNTAPGIPATDLDGNARISNTTVDLGAYEHSIGDYHPADTNSDWVISSAEFTAYSDSWKTTASTIDIDYVTRAGYLLQNGTPVGTYKNVGGGKPLCWVPAP